MRSNSPSLRHGQRQRRREGASLAETMAEAARAEAAAAASDRAEAKLALLQGGVIVFVSFCVFVFGGLGLRQSTIDHGDHKLEKQRCVDF